MLHYFNSLNNSSIRNNIDLRLKLIQQLKDIVKAHEDDIIEAFNKDLHRNSFTTRIMDFNSFYSEIDFFLKHTAELAKEKEVETAAFFKPHRSFIVPRPFGKILILVPFNYPMALSLSPLVGSIAAGNSTLLRMSSKNEHITALFLKIFNDLPKEIVQFITCSYEEADQLITAGFDKILYTGSPKVGRHIMKLASQTLTPVLLELGGKSPLIIDETCVMDQALPSAVWGKCTNAGQTCVAPDYIFIKRERLAEFKEEVAKIIKNFYPEGMRASPDFCRMIDVSAYDRVADLITFTEKHAEMIAIDDEMPVRDERFVPFRAFIFQNLEEALNADIMKREIFGPVWPIIPYDDIEEVFDYLALQPAPLALYVYSEDEELIQRFVNDIPAGSIVANDTMIQFENHSLPFGGVGNSGMGGYHAQYTFESLSYMKPFMKRTFTGVAKTADIRFPPNTPENEEILKNAHE